MSEYKEEKKNPIADRLGKRTSTLPKPQVEKEKEKDETAYASQAIPAEVKIEFTSNLIKKKADPWTNMNVKVPTKASYEAYAKKHGVTAQQLMNFVLDKWIEEKQKPRK